MHVYIYTYHMKSVLPNTLTIFTISIFGGHLSSFHGHFEIAGEPLCAGTIKVRAACTWCVSFLWGKVIHHCSPSPSCRLVLDLKASVMLVVVVVVVVVLSPLLLLDSFCSNGSNKYGSSYYHAQQSRVKGGHSYRWLGPKDWWIKQVMKPIKGESVWRTSGFFKELGTETVFDRSEQSDGTRGFSGNPFVANPS